MQGHFGQQPVGRHGDADEWRAQCRSRPQPDRGLHGRLDAQVLRARLAAVEHHHVREARLVHPQRVQPERVQRGLLHHRHEQGLRLHALALQGVQIDLHVVGAHAEELQALQHLHRQRRLVVALEAPALAAQTHAAAEELHDLGPGRAPDVHQRERAHPPARPAFDEHLGAHQHREPRVAVQPREQRAGQPVGLAQRCHAVAGQLIGQLLRLPDADEAEVGVVGRAPAAQTDLVVGNHAHFQRPAAAEDALRQIQRQRVRGLARCDHLFAQPAEIQRRQADGRLQRLRMGQHLGQLQGQPDRVVAGPGQKAHQLGDIRFAVAGRHVLADAGQQRRRDEVVGSEAGHGVVGAPLLIEGQQPGGERKVGRAGLRGIQEPRLLAVALAPEAGVAEVDADAARVLVVELRVLVGDLREGGRILEGETGLRLGGAGGQRLAFEAPALLGVVSRSAAAALVAFIDQQQVGALIARGGLAHALFRPPPAPAIDIELGDLGHAHAQAGQPGGLQLGPVLRRQAFARRQQQQVGGVEQPVRDELPQVHVQHQGLAGAGRHEAGQLAGVGCGVGRKLRQVGGADRLDAADVPRRIVAQRLQMPLHHRAGQPLEVRRHEGRRVLAALGGVGQPGFADGRLVRAECRVPAQQGLGRHAAAGQRLQGAGAAADARRVAHWAGGGEQPRQIVRAQAEAQSKGARQQQAARKRPRQHRRRAACRQPGGGCRACGAGGAAGGCHAVGAPGQRGTAAGANAGSRTHIACASGVSIDSPRSPSPSNTRSRLWRMRA